MIGAQALDIASVSVIIANLNCPILDQALEALYTQQLERGVSLEVIVIGQDQPGCLSRFPQTTNFHTEIPVGPAAARNIGIRHAHGQLIACLDADCVPDPYWISEMIGAHRQHPREVIVGGSIKIEADNVWALADNLSSFHAYLPTRPSTAYSVLPTCNVSMRREAFDVVGLFDESFLINEDVDWMMRARRQGFSLYFCPAARVWHRTQRRSFSAMLRHAMQWGFHSIVNRHRYSDLESLPFVLKSWWSLALLSPLIATGVAAGIFIRNPVILRYLYAFPLIWLAKLAWCWGAARRLKQGITF